MNTRTKSTQKAALFAALVLCVPAHAMTGKAGQMVAKPASSLLSTQARQCATRFFSSPAAQNVCRMTAVGAFAQARNLSLAPKQQESESWWSSFRSLFGIPEELQKERAATRHYAEELFKQTSEFQKISDDFSKTLLKDVKTQEDERALEAKVQSAIAALNAGKSVDFDFALSLKDLANNIKKSTLLKTLAEATQKHIQQRIPLITYHKVDTTVPLDRQWTEKEKELQRLVGEDMLIKQVMPAIHEEALKNLQTILDRETLTKERAYWQRYAEETSKLEKDFTGAIATLESKKKEALGRWLKASPEERKKIETIRFNYVGPLDFAQQKWQLEQQKKGAVTP